MKISQATYLKAQGLFHLAAEHERKCEEFTDALCKLLQADSNDYIMDAIYNSGSTLDEALRKAKIEVDEK